jgi:CRP-like cAMP-binding protein
MSVQRNHVNEDGGHMIDKERLKKVLLFKDLSQEELEKISHILREAHYPKGTLIWEEGSSEQGLQIIDYGKVKVTRLTQEGHPQVLAILKADKFFGELSILDGRAHSASLEALEDTKVLILGKDDMDRLLKEAPLIAFKIVREMTIAISEILREMNNKFIKMVDYIWE